MSHTPEEEIAYGKLKKGGRIKDEFRQRKMLNTSEVIKLSDLIRSTYAERSLLDADFAKVAAEELGFQISIANVIGIRKSLQIESTYERVTRVQREERAARKLQAEADKRERQFIAARPANAQVPAISPALVADPTVAKLLVGVEQLYSDWRLFEQRAMEMRASTTARIDRQELEIEAAKRHAESAERDAKLAREQVVALERKYHALQETMRIELEKLTSRVRLVTTAAGSILTEAHPNGHSSHKHG